MIQVKNKGTYSQARRGNNVPPYPLMRAPSR